MFKPARKRYYKPRKKTEQERERARKERERVQEGIKGTLSLKRVYK